MVPTKYGQDPKCNQYIGPLGQPIILLLSVLVDRITGEAGDSDDL